MTVRYHKLPGDDDYLSDDWFVIIEEAIEDGVITASDISDGHRTMELQAQRVREHGVWSTSNPTGAARPSNDAPHIWTGRQNHAIDMNVAKIPAFQRWLSNRGVSSSTPISTEDWHLWVSDAAALRRLADKIRKEKATPKARIAKRPIRPGDRGVDVRRVQVYLKRGGYFDGRPAKRVGTYGRRMVPGVKRFQREVGLKPDGIIGVKTYVKLYRRYNHES